jgi:hypothetical protein
MGITKQQLEKELDGFGHHRIEIVAELAHQGPSDGIGPALILAMGSRETELCNITGDGGHGRGWVQIDDRFHHIWLNQHAGCKSGSWKATFSTALPIGRVPTLTAATLRAIDVLRGNMAFAAQHDVPKAQRLRFAIAAYNAGAGGALTGFRAGDVDRETAHRDYSKDVLERKAVISAYLKRHNLPV